MLFVKRGQFIFCDAGKRFESLEVNRLRLVQQFAQVVIGGMLVHELFRRELRLNAKAFNLRLCNGEKIRRAICCATVAGVAVAGVAVAGVSVAGVSVAGVSAAGVADTAASSPCLAVIGADVFGYDLTGVVFTYKTSPLPF